MSSIIGIPSTRISDLFVRQRMLTQVQSDQSDIYRIESQLSSGHRFDVPSQNPVAAMQVMMLQSLLERKAQMTSNLNTSQTFLSATDSALTNVSSMLADVRGAALSVMGTTASDTQRKTAAQQVEQALQQLVETGNQQFRGRYLFAGSNSTIRPLDYVNSGFVGYAGNSQALVTYADINQLLDTNLSGAEAFGAISERVLGSMDLNPVLTFDTRLADLHAGQGISRGSIAVSDGAHTSIVDLGSAETVGDVAALIQAHPPTGRAVQVEIAPDRLIVTLDSNAPGSLSIHEVGGGAMANELGLLREIGAGKTIEGRDLNPALLKSTSLDNLLGIRARASVRSQGSDNDFIVEADTNGVATADGKPLNGVTVSFVNDPLVEPGQETVVYNGGNSLQVHIADGYSTAKNVVAAINAAHAAGDVPFTARLDPLDSGNAGRGKVGLLARGTTDYGQGKDFDRTNGLEIVNQGKTHTIAFPLAKTIEDLLNTLNGAGLGINAEINDEQNGLNLLSHVSGCDFTVGEHGGITAEQLGLRSFTRTTRLDDLNFGRGVDDFAGTGARSSVSYDSLVPNSSLTFTARNGGTYWNAFPVTFSTTLAAPSLTYDRVGRTMNFQVNANTTANDLIALVQQNPQAAADWDVSLTAVSGATNDGTGKIAAPGNVLTAGGDNSGVDFTITRADGTAIAIDVSNRQTVGDIIDAINNDFSNLDHKLVARLSVYGNGIELADASQGAGKFTVAKAFGSNAAIDLGLIAAGASSSQPATTSGYPQTIIPSTAAKSGLIFKAKSPGTDLNGVRVIFQLGGPPAPVYDAVAKTLTFGVTAATKAQDVVAMLAASPLSTTFSAIFDPADDSGNTGTNSVATTDPLAPPETGGGTATTYAQAKVVSAGFDNDLLFTSKALGTASNNVAIKFVAVSGGPTQVTSYNPGVELVVQFDPGVSTANDVIAAVGIHPTAKNAFTVTPDPADASPNDGSGLVDPTTGAEPAMDGGQQSATGRDVNPLETESIFTALIRVKQGLETNDQFLIERSLDLLQRKTVDMNFARASLGAREQGVDVNIDRLDTENVDLQQALSLDYDADLAEVASNLASRQASYQASLQAIAKIYQTSLLNYL